MSWFGLSSSSNTNATINDDDNDIVVVEDQDVVAAAILNDLESGGRGNASVPLKATSAATSLDTSPSSSLSGSCANDTDTYTDCLRVQHQPEAKEEGALEVHYYHNNPQNTSNSSNRSNTIRSNNSNDNQREQEVGAVSFRPLQSSDRLRIQQLHEQWFPVQYSDAFYEDLVTNHRLTTSGDPLFTCVATFQGNENVDSRDSHTSSAQQMYCRAAGEGSLPQQQQQQENEEVIGCCVGSFIHHSRLTPEISELLLPNTEQHSRLFYIMTLGTLDEYRNLGVATSLIQQCIHLVEDDPSCGALYLHVIPFNHAAIRFYEKLGFYRVCTIPNYYTIDKKDYDCFLYAKYFNGNRGHRTFYKLVSGAISSIWKVIKIPLKMFADDHGDGDDDGVITVQLASNSE